MHFGFIKDVSMKSGRLIAGLDIGTSKICAIVGEIHSDAMMSSQSSSRGVMSCAEIIAVGMAPSKGIKKGVVTNIEGAMESIRAAIDEVQEIAGVEIHAVHVGVTGGHISSIPSHGVIAVKEKEIGQREVDQVIDAAKAVAIPFDREILHVIPVGYAVNGENGITDPRGMGGVRLETKVQIITGAAASIQNLIRSCEKTGLEVMEVVFQPLASASAVLTQDEKELGVALVDMGGGTTDIVIFHEGNLCHSSVLPIGGNNFTNDIAVGLRIPTKEAEDIKRRHGCTMISLVKDDDEIEIDRAGSNTRKAIPRSYLVEIIQPRAEELLGMVKKEISDRGLHRLMNSGVVLTGGASLMEGLDVMAENILELPIRIGNPADNGGNRDVSNPAFAAGVGLVYHGAQDLLGDHIFEKGGMISGMKNRMRGWIDTLLKG